MRKKRYRILWHRLIIAVILLILIITSSIKIISYFSKNRTNNEQTTTVNINYQLEEKNAKNTEKSEKKAMLRFCSLSVINCEVEN